MTGYDENKNQIVPVISVIVPVYNAERFLKRCLDSIIEQSFKDYEVLMIDDGSTDGSVKICKDFCDRDERFAYIFQENAGPDMARKTGVEKARGEYLKFIDADDYVSSDAFEKELDAAGKTEADIVCSQIVRFDGKKEWAGSVFIDGQTILSQKKDIARAFFESGILIGTYYAKLIERSVLKDYGFIRDGLIGEDITAALYMFDRASKIVIIPDRTYFYYQNGDSISHAKYSFRHAVSLDNYIRLRNEHLKRKLVSEERICGYFAGYQMAVATAMGRKGTYIPEVGNLLRDDLKDHWDMIRKDRGTGTFMRSCIKLYLIAPKLFVSLFRVLYLMTGR